MFRRSLHTSAHARTSLTHSCSRTTIAEIYQETRRILSRRECSLRQALAATRDISTLVPSPSPYIYTLRGSTLREIFNYCGGHCTMSPARTGKILIYAVCWSLIFDPKRFASAVRFYCTRTPPRRILDFMVNSDSLLPTSLNLCYSQYC